MALPSGTKLGPYEVLGPLGAGGMGEVYRARDTRLERDVAIKVLPGHLSTHPDLRARFEREAKHRRGQLGGAAPESACSDRQCAARPALAKPLCASRATPAAGWASALRTGGW
jgi:hypothetical protein